eukprot:1080969-Rhodomonas_salina.4
MDHRRAHAGELGSSLRRATATQAGCTPLLVGQRSYPPTEVPAGATGPKVTVLPDDCSSQATPRLLVRDLRPRRRALESQPGTQACHRSRLRRRPGTVTSESGHGSEPGITALSRCVCVPYVCVRACARRLVPPEH